MAKASTPRPGASLEDLFTALLVIAGTWYILNQALRAADSKRDKDSETGEEWADRVLREIEEAKKRESDGERLAG